MRAFIVLTLLAAGAAATPKVRDVAASAVAGRLTTAPYVAQAVGPAASHSGSESAEPAPSAVVVAALPAVPAAVSAPVADLRGEVQRLIDATGWRGDAWSITVVSLDRGDTLVAIQPDLALAPASNMKLFTTAAALYYLGPQYRYSTFLLADGPVENGVLSGDLIVYGTGDPTFSDRFGRKMAAWRAFGDTLKALGIREVHGDLIADASYFGGAGTAEGWQESYMNASYAAPAGALSYAENIATLQIKPAEQVGWRPQVRLVPGGDGIAIVNEAQTVASRRSFINVMRTAYDGPIMVRGQIARGSLGVLRSVPVSDPARYAAAVLREQLARDSIRIAGEIRSVHSPEDSPVTGRMVFAPAFLNERPPLRVLAVYQSPPLIDILEVVNKKSHNLLAEQTLRTVGRVALGDGSIEGGAKAVEHLLSSEAGFVPANLNIADGSGLSVLNRVTSRSVIHLLSFMAKSPMWDDYWFTLPEAGARDGLRRMYRTAAEHNLRAKTGTINNVSALSGYVRAANGERLAFSIISNNVPSTYRAKRIEDAVGARLAAFNRPVAPEPGKSSSAEPEPASPGSEPAPAPASASAGERQAAARAETSTASAATAAPAKARTHTIKKGDTLEGIAKRYGTTVRKLQQANPGLSPRRLIPGKQVKLP